MMASMSSSGTSSASGCSLGTTRSSRRSSEDDTNLLAQMENRRKRRKESNRESARRSRLRKQQHLDDLNSQANQLKDQNKQLGAVLRVTNQNLVAVQAQNSVLQTQKMELESRLGSLIELLLFLNAGTATTSTTAAAAAATSSSAADYSAMTNMNHNGITTTGGGAACEAEAVLGDGISTWSQLQPVGLYFPCF